MKVVVFKVSLENVIPFEPTIEIKELDKPLVIIRGPNGIGKTTLIKAILGSFKTEGNVKLPGRAREVITFINAGEEMYRITRTTGSAKVELIYNGKVHGEDLGKKAFSKRVVKEGLEKHIETLSLVSPTEGIVAIGEKSLKEALIKIIGLEKLLKTLRELGTIINKKIGEYDGHVSSLSKMIKKKEKLLKKREEELREIEKRIKELEEFLSKASIEELRSKVEKLEEELREIEKEAAKYEEIVRRYKELEEQYKRIHSVERIIEILGEEAPEVYKFYRLGGYKIIENVDKLLQRLAALGFSGSVESLIERLEELKARRDELYEAYKAEKSRYDKLLGEVETKRRALEEAKKKYDKAYSRASEIVKKSMCEVDVEDPEAVERLEACLTERLEEKKRRLEDLRSRYSQIEGKLREIERIEALLKEAEARCPVCGKPLEEEEREKIIKETREKKSSLIEEQEELRKEISVLEKEVKRIEREKNRLVQEFSRLYGEIKSYKKELKELGKSLAELEAALKSIDYKSLEKDYKRLSEAVEAIQELSSLYEKRKEAKDILSRIEEKVKLVDERSVERLSKVEERLLINAKQIIDEYRSLREKIEAYREIEAKKNRLLNELEKLRSELEEREKRIEEAKKKLSELLGRRDERRRELSELKAEIDRLKEEIKRYERVGIKYKNLSKKLHGRSNDSRKVLEREIVNILVQGINKAFEEILPKIGSAVQLRMVKLVSKDGNLKLAFRRADEDSSIGERYLSDASGGERLLLSILFALAIRKALGLSHLPLFLDEPTANANRDLREDIANLIHKALSEGVVSQIFVATHSEEFVELLRRRIKDFVEIELYRVGGFTRAKIVS